MLSTWMGSQVFPDDSIPVVAEVPGELFHRGLGGFVRVVGRERVIVPRTHAGREVPQVSFPGFRGVPRRLPGVRLVVLS